MDLPRSSSDIRLATACPVCLGNGGFGSRTRDGGNPHQSCTTCEGSGWQLKALPDIPPELAARIRDKLAPIPLDADTANHQDATREQLETVLNRRWIESIGLPEGEAVHIDLFGKRGDILRIQPQFHGGKFRNLTAIPFPPT